MSVLIVLLLLTYGGAATLYAIRMRQERDDFRRANEIRTGMIDATREGKPPFLLNPGVRIITEDGRGAS